MEPPEAVAEFGAYLGEAGDLTLGGEAVAVYHGTSEVLLDGLVESGSYDYVFHGHTHAHALEERDGTVRVNPGGLPIPVEDADDAARVATLDTEESGVDAVEHHVLRT